MGVVHPIVGDPALEGHAGQAIEQSAAKADIGAAGAAIERYLARAAERCGAHERGVGSARYGIVGGGAAGFVEIPLVKQGLCGRGRWRTREHCGTGQQYQGLSCFDYFHLLFLGFRVAVI